MALISIASLSLLCTLQAQPPQTPPVGSEPGTPAAQFVFHYTDLPQLLNVELVGSQQSKSGDRQSEFRIRLQENQKGELHRECSLLGRVEFSLSMSVGYPEVRWTYPLGSYELKPGEATHVYPAMPYSIESRVRQVSLSITNSVGEPARIERGRPVLLLRGFEDGKPKLRGRIALQPWKKNWVLFPDALPDASAKWVDALLHIPGQPLVLWSNLNAELSMTIGPAQERSLQVSSETQLRAGDYWIDPSDIGPQCQGILGTVPPSGVSGPVVPVVPVVPTRPTTPKPPSVPVVPVTPPKAF